jgi:hypothetical protein
MFKLFRQDSLTSSLILPTLLVTERHTALLIQCVESIVRRASPDCSLISEAAFMSCFGIVSVLTA